MRIITIRPAQGGTGRTRALAVFDVELTPEIAMYGLRLVEAPNGRRLSYPPTCHGRRAATFAPEFADQITAAAVAAFEGRVTADDRRAA